MKRQITIWLTILICLCGLHADAEESKNGMEVPMPSVLQGQSFVFDELDSGVGTSLYTLMFSEDGYRLYHNEAGGLLLSGKIHAYANRTLLFEDGAENFWGSYRGSAFESPSVEIEFRGTDMKFTLASENSEYVYLNQLGIYESEIDEKSAILILERWFEYYLHMDEKLYRGTYEINTDGNIVLTDYDGEIISGTVNESGFELVYLDGIFTFNQAEKQAEYVATHAMGEYTLSVYNSDVFAIHGVDGLVKAIGQMEWSDDGGYAVYFPRKVTGEVELNEKFKVSFEVSEDNLLFPNSTYLLPRSGNIDDKTGVGSYWSAGTILEFLPVTAIPLELTVEYAPRQESWTEDDIPLENTPGESGLLRQSMPSLGTAKPLTLLIDFPDQCRPRFIQADDIERELFSLEEEDSLNSYYFRSSYGNLTIDGTVLDWYRTEKNRNQYELDKEIIREAIEYHIRENDLNLSDYDSDQDGEVDSLYVLWAGDMDSSNHMWSSAYRSSWNASPEEWSAAVWGYIFVPGTTVWSAVPPLKCNVNSLTHETGHLLGLNDYYSYDTTGRTDYAEAYTGGALEGGLGGMDMMDVNMGDHNAFSKWMLGWLQPEIVEYAEIAALAQEERVYTLHPSNESPEALFIKLKDTASMFTEYLVIEVISSTMNAGEFTRLKEPMVRILHVDASLDEEGFLGNWRAYGFKNDNSYTTTKFISILEADGRDDVLNHLPANVKLSYDVEDYFTVGDVLAPGSYPNTHGYDAFGNATVYNGLMITVESISPEGEAVIRLAYAAQPDTLQVIQVTPQPMIVPCTEDDCVKVPSGTDQLEIEFDRPIVVNADRIRVSSHNTLIDEWQTTTEGSVLKIILDDGMKKNCDYTVVIPHGAVASEVEPAVVNNCNLIYGFVTE